jgi:hypothetical protein
MTPGPVALPLVAAEALTEFAVVAVSIAVPATVGAIGSVGPIRALGSVRPVRTIGLAWAIPAAVRPPRPIPAIGAVWAAPAAAGTVRPVRPVRAALSIGAVGTLRAISVGPRGAVGLARPLAIRAGRALRTLAFRR